MSTITTREPSLLDPTRQQLDELEQLLERMLQIPVLDLEEVSDNWRLGHRETAEQQVASAVAGTKQNSQPAAHSLAPLMVNAASPVLTLPTIDLSGASSIHVEISAAEPLPSISEASSETVDHSRQGELAFITVEPTPTRNLTPARKHKPHRPLRYLPLVTINGVFDVSTRVLGPFGRWLRGLHGRDAIGWAGVFMLIAAAGWGVVEAALRWSPRLAP